MKIHTNNTTCQNILTDANLVTGSSYQYNMEVYLDTDNLSFTDTQYTCLMILTNSDTCLSDATYRYWYQDYWYLVQYSEWAKQKTDSS